MPTTGKKRRRDQVGKPERSAAADGGAFYDDQEAKRYTLSVEKSRVQEDLTRFALAILLSSPSAASTSPTLSALPTPHAPHAPHAPRAPPTAAAPERL